VKSETYFCRILCTKEMVWSGSHDPINFKNIHYFSYPYLILKLRSFLLFVKSHVLQTVRLSKFLMKQRTHLVRLVRYYR